MHSCRNGRMSVRAHSGCFPARSIRAIGQHRRPHELLLAPTPRPHSRPSLSPDSTLPPTTRIHSSSASTSASTSGSSRSVAPRGAVIVGGGPCGLATALMLARRGWSDIKILESNPDIAGFDPSRAFVLGIDGRGQKFLEDVGLVGKLPEYGVSVKEASLTVVAADGSVKRSKLPVKDDQKTVYFMPRPRFIELLHEGVKPYVESKTISIHVGTQCTSITRIEGDRLHVTATSSSGESMSFEPRLVVGADGLHSKVRQTCHEWDPSGRFKMVKRHSDSAGLRYKVLMLPPNPMANKEGTEILENGSIAAIRGVLKGQGKHARLGLLPVKDPNAMRPANIIVREPHTVMEAKTTDELYDFLETNFPQIPVRQLVTLESAQQFVNSSGGRFPTPQACQGLYYMVGESSSSGASSTSSGEGPSGVLILGDACKSFPPDLGQGVNSALEDVFELSKLMEEHSNQLHVVLPAYERERASDVQALVRIQQFGFPYQYGQDQVRLVFWGMNTMLRKMLNQAMPNVFAPSAFTMIQDPSLSYSTILERADRTTRMLQAALGVLVVIVIAVVR